MPVSITARGGPNRIENVAALTQAQARDTLRIIQAHLEDGRASGVLTLFNRTKDGTEMTLERKNRFQLMFGYGERLEDTKNAMLALLQRANLPGAKEALETYLAAKPEGEGNRISARKMLEILNQHLEQAPKGLREKESGLDKLLDQVIENAADIKTPNDVYRRYCTVDTPNRLVPPGGDRDQAKDEFFDQMGKLSRNRPVGFRCSCQRQSAWVDTDIALAERNSQRQGARDGDPGALQSTRDIEASFYHFTRGDGQTATERIYINVSKAHAATLMAHLVRNVIYKPEDFPGVTGGKVAGPGFDESADEAPRPDGIVLYLADRKAQEAVIQELEKWQQEHPEHFMRAVPLMTESALKGVSKGAEPNPEVLINAYISKAQKSEKATSGTSEHNGLKVPKLDRNDASFSFGSLRSQAIFDALQELKGPQGKSVSYRKDEFRELVKKHLAQHGVDPENPENNRRIRLGGGARTRRAEMLNVHYENYLRRDNGIALLERLKKVLGKLDDPKDASLKDLRPEEEARLRELGRMSKDPESRLPFEDVLRRSDFELLNRLEPGLRVAPPVVDVSSYLDTELARGPALGNSVDCVIGRPSLHP